MNNLVESMLNEFQGGRISRRQLIQTIALAATAYAAGEATIAEAAPPGTLGFHTIGVNHISYNVSGKDYSVARDFYVKNFGFDYVPAQDTGGQCYLPFGPKDNSCFFLPRGGRDPNAGPAPERGGGGGGARGARGGAGTGAAPGGEAANRGGNGSQQPTTLLVDEFGLTISNFDARKTEEDLKKAGLDPKRDGETLRVVDPFGMELVISSPRVSPY